VTQVRLFGGRRGCCGERVSAEPPPGLEQGSPFGSSVAAVVVSLHYAHAIGLQRLAMLMAELFSLSISEGAISNILARAPLLRAAATIKEVVLASPVVCSDETSVRVNGKTCWEWVFVATFAVLHVIRSSRGKAVVRALFDTIRPAVWVSDMLGSQRGMARAGRCAPRICCAMQDMRLRLGIPPSVPRSGACCCAPSPSGDDERPLIYRISGSIKII
jgi:transposase